MTIKRKPKDYHPDNYPRFDVTSAELCGYDTKRKLDGLEERGDYLIFLYDFLPEGRLFTIPDLIKDPSWKSEIIGLSRSGARAKLSKILMEMELYELVICHTEHDRGHLYYIRREDVIYG